MINKNKYGSCFVNGEPTEGCQLCWPGAKLVLFVGGKCTQNCFYCPISEQRKGKDQAYANERPINSDEDLLTEAKEMRAKGASLTGGEPVIYLEKCLHYIKLLKKEFGPKFHIHLYTYGILATEEVVRKLEQAGLDEIRFHLLDNFERILPALNSKIKTGVEVPVFPNQRSQLIKLLDFCTTSGIVSSNSRGAQEHAGRVLDKNKVAFVNLNELEFSDTNAELMERQGFEPKGEFEFGVKGSEALALEMLAYAQKNHPNLPVHFCPVFIKTRVQWTNRMKRRAETIKKPFEKVTSGGMLLKGVVEGEINILKKIAAENKTVCLNLKKQRIETSVQNAKTLAKKYRLKAFEVEEVPIYEPWDWEKTPI